MVLNAHLISESVISIIQMTKVSLVQQALILIPKGYTRIALVMGTTYTFDLPRGFSEEDV